MSRIQPTTTENGSIIESTQSRLSIENDRLRRCLEALIRANRSVLMLGRNDEIEDLARGLGIADPDYVCFDLRVKRQRASVICVPSRLWVRPAAMSAFFELKAAGAALGHRIVLVPEQFVRRQPRLDNARMVASTLDVEIDPTDRMNILEFLLEHGGGTLSDVAGLVRHPDPVAAVLHLVTVGALDIDLNAPILPASEVRFAAASR